MAPDVLSGQGYRNIVICGRLVFVFINLFGYLPFG
jgi:hypothetical protein